MTEFLDVVSSERKPTGVQKERAAVHKDGDWHNTVHVWIVNSKAELILQKRHAYKYSNPNKWDISVAGHIETGATSVATAIKETREELGLVISEADLEWLFSCKSSDVIGNGYLDREFHDVYLIHKDLDIMQLNYQPEEVAGVRLINFHELEQLIEVGHPDYVPHAEEYALLFSELHRRFS